MPKCRLCDKEKPENDLVKSSGTFRVCKECCPTEKTPNFMEKTSYDPSMSHVVTQFTPREPDDPIGTQFEIDGKWFVVAAQSKEDPRDYLALELNPSHGFTITISTKMGITKDGKFVEL